MPFSERVSAHLFPYSVPISTHGVTVLLFKTICKNVQIHMEAENKGEGIGTEPVH